MPAPKKNPAATPVLVPRTLLTACRALLAALEARDVEAQQDAAESIEAVLATIDPPVPTDPVEMLETLKITKIDRQGCSGGGSWVSGRIAGHRFEALVFPEHAERESYELDKSRISKLWLKNTITGETVANFERGWDIRPTTDDAQQIVDLLSAGLAETVFGK